MDKIPTTLWKFGAGPIQTHSNIYSEADVLGDHVRSESIAHEKKHSNMRNLQLREITLAKLGFTRDSPVDWTNTNMPQKGDLHKLLHFQIANYMNPDTFIKIGTNEYRCHRLVLQCYSKFFSGKADSHIELPETHVSKNAFAYIYDWMLYVGRDSYTLLRRDTILEIFMAAKYLQVKELVEQCWAFIDNEEFFSEDTAFMLYLDARAHHYTEVMELMVPRIQRFFLTLVASKDFLELSVEEICVFLQSNYICIHCEMEVFMSAVRWLMFDWEERQKYLVAVMECVRFGLICPWQLVEIRRNPDNQEFLLVTSNPAVSKMIEDGLAFATVKHWSGEDAPNNVHWVEALALTEPMPRNWAGTPNLNEQKRFTTYKAFLDDLVKYRELQTMALKRNSDKTSASTSESQVSDVDESSKLIDSEDYLNSLPKI